MLINLIQILGLDFEISPPSQGGARGGYLSFETSNTMVRVCNIPPEKTLNAFSHPPFEGGLSSQQDRRI